MNGERFKTTVNYFDSGPSENKTPFKLQYLQSEVLETRSPSPSDYEGYTHDSNNQIISTNPFKQDLLLTTENQIGNNSIINQPIENDSSSFEMFSHEIHDLEFADVLGEIASEAEQNLYDYLSGHESINNLEEALADPNFNSTLNQFFDSTYGPLAARIESEIDRLSTHIEQNVHSNMSQDEAQSVIESFQVVEPDEFLGKVGKFLKKVTKGVATVIKKGASIALSGPLKALLSKIKPLIKPMLSKVVKSGLGLLPEKYRSLAQKALDSLGGNSKQIDPSQAPPTEIVTAKTNPDEIYEIDEESIENQMYDINEVEHEFDRQIFLLSQETEGRAAVEEEIEENVIYEFADAEQTPIENEVTTLNQARNDFISGLTNGSDVVGDTREMKDLTQDFIPAILPALKLGFSLIGRPRIVNLIATLVAKILEPLVSKDQATPLSRAIVDAGLRMVNLETYDPVSKEQYLGSTVANIVTETVDRIAQLPSNMLEADDDEVLQSFVQEALLESIADNVNYEVLNEATARLRELPETANWIPMNNGKYKVLSKKYQIVIDPKMASSIRTSRRAETLADVLRNYQDWDGRTAPAIVSVFEAVPLTRLSMIARDYIGGASRKQIKQVIPLSRRAAILLLKEPQLAIRNRTQNSISGMRFYYVKLGDLKGVPSSVTVADSSTRNNDLDLRFVPPDKLEVRLYLNEPTSQRIKGITDVTQAAELYKELEFLILPTGQKMLTDLLLRLKVPSFVTKAVLSQILSWIIKNLKSKLSSIVKELSQEVDKPESGVSISIIISLPQDFLLSLPNLSVEKVGEFISKLYTIEPSANIQVTSGYKL